MGLTHTSQSIIIGIEHLFGPQKLLAFFNAVDNVFTHWSTVFLILYCSIKIATDQRTFIY